MKRSKPSIFVYILAYVAIAMRWMRSTAMGRVVTAGVMILLVSSTYNHLSAAPFFAENAKPQLTETEKVELKGKEEIAKKAEIQKQKVEEAKTLAHPITSHTYSLIITKSSYRITLLDNGEPIKEYNCAVGRNPGQKTKTGDAKTPVGSFKVESINPSSDWVSDEDGKGAYGPWFITLDTKELSKGEWNGIGISGTNKPEGLGRASSAGSVRVRNSDIEEIKKYVKVGTIVTIKE
ncbi:MAG: L,D-transpeptidase [Acidaminococcaceae bacterium]|jgi:lipoprotein-anchoring transpeptidase ErfK/SrfK|uniref:L,D-transpeptidase n=1 Tax=Succiniclasticum sp. TaxID=2775030 RepID=UPI000E7E1EE2|nr:L,D-transpeptidase [Succiniclasticum sp.]MBO5636827.1 L,D-transpeptidase [Acidaminococcaceae bacterium]MBP3812934.1 L,D-transpeptidase [Acidaminococcaceae bacterium]MBR1495789.1 L,D-transpeptidase [Acidaminococcaceae bacterium]MBR1660684.1 L,D-transpeptidase [Acidaminococcaceae bacterium]MDY6290944.1 L,D-transpeptidase [Succiniclasticum sp.]